MAAESREIIDKYLPQIAMLLFVAIYWTSSVAGNLNIGVRHLMPAFPFTMALAAGGDIRFRQPRQMGLRARGRSWRVANNFHCLRLSQFFGLL